MMAKSREAYADRAERNHGQPYKQAAQSNRDWHREPLFIPHHSNKGK
jgi:hypothetical protein